ncbi:hypothetical protein JCM24511_07260 [Saitozyma sp. JCM 24511]|nr:hypothetical protein JCM24511_07260 [Saitozyma sp. JCM 24511]
MTVLEFVHWVIMAGLEPSLEVTERRPAPTLPADASLTFVNADTTWLVQIPLRDPTASRRWYNILLDPWLTGSQSDVASWFSKQSHAVEPALGGIGEVEQFCRKVEELSGRRSETSGDTNHADSPTSPSLIDAVAISHEFTDHCHEATLRQCDPSVPVFANRKAVDLIRGWKHFDTVIESPPFDGEHSNWREASVDPLPTIMITFPLSSDPDDSDPTAEAIIYTPHGIHAPSLSSVASAAPSIRTLALLHGLHDVSIDWGQQLNLGAHNGLAAQRALHARYWIGTHDEEKKGGGLVSWFLRRKAITVEDALLEAAAKGDGEAKEEGNVLGDGEFMELGNGKSAILA